MNQNLSQHGAVAEAGSIIVIGAGIIGVTAALRLLADGHSVTLLDRGDVAGETSGGNAGAFAFSDIEPLAAPGILRKAPGWLLDPLGPLSLRPAYAVRMMPWLLHFWRSSQPKRHLYRQPRKPRNRLHKTQRVVRGHQYKSLRAPLQFR